MNALIRTALTALALSAVMLAGPSPARADKAEPMTPKQAFEHSDTNGDGNVDVEEFRSRNIEIFVIMDANADGFIVITEVADEHKGKFVAVDANGDGRVNLHEFLAYVMPAFWEEYDTNKDTVLTLDEVEAVAARKQ